MNENNSFRWGYAFLQTDTRLDLKARFELIYEAVEMYLSDETSRDVKGEKYDGTIKMKGYATLGTFGGVRFEAKIDTEKGKANLSFLINEQTGAAFGHLERDASLLN